MPALSGEFVDDTHVRQCSDRAADRRCTERHLRMDLRHGQHDAACELLEHLADIARAPPQRRDARAILRQQGEQALCRVDRLLRGVGHAIEEEAEPAFPVAARAHAVEHLVVVAAAALEVEAQVQAGLAQHALTEQTPRSGCRQAIPGRSGR